MRAVLVSTLVPLLGCSTLLGIEDPSAGNPVNHTDGGSADGIDAPGGEHLLFNVSDFQLAQLQRARIHVTRVHEDGSMNDVTQTAAYASDNVAIVKIGGQGVIDSADMQPGSATITASVDGAASATVKVTVRATTVCHPVINELTTGGTGGPADEYVEIYNPCTTDMDVTNWTLNYRGPKVTGTTDSTPMVTLLAPSMTPGEIRLYAGIGYTGTATATWPGANGVIGKDDGAVGLRNGPMSTGMLVDSIAYGAAAPGNPFIQKNPTATVPTGSSASRLPFDGKNDGDGASDFMVVSTLTPGALNAP